MKDGFDISEFEKLPFTHKEDIAQSNNDFCSIPEESIREFVTTSGTLGEPVTIFLSENDLNRLAVNEADSLLAMGCNSNDTFQLLTTIDKQFMAGIAYYSGVLKLGGKIIRSGPGMISNQWRNIFNYKTTVLIAVPRFISAMLDYADENNIDYKNSAVRKIICIGEPLHHDDFSFNEIGDNIKKRWDIDLRSTYASTEMATAFYECDAQNGVHNNDDLLYTEVIGEDGRQVQNGEKGEVVITTLGVEGTPFIRYKTGDIARFWSSPCSCGRNSLRIGPIIGRKQQLIKYKGTTIYPQSIFNLLNQVPGVKTYFVEVIQKNATAETVKIFLAEEETAQFPIETLKDKMKSGLKVLPTIELMSKKSIESFIFGHNNRKPKFIRITQL